MPQSSGLLKFTWTLLVLQAAFIAAFAVMVRYHESADAKHVQNQLGTDKELKENLEKYPGQWFEPRLTGPGVKKSKLSFLATNPGSRSQKASKASC